MHISAVRAGTGPSLGRAPRFAVWDEVTHMRGQTKVGSKCDRSKNLQFLIRRSLREWPAKPQTSRRTSIFSRAIVGPARRFSSAGRASHSSFDRVGGSSPLSAKGKPTLRLDTLASANGFAHEIAHGALADVEATIYIARLTPIDEIVRRAAVVSVERRIVPKSVSTGRRLGVFLDCLTSAPS
jgi:hypothetical protein